ncbi:MAG: GGDEF domain-containing protein [Meiothermus sp.]|nr:GGDEF domain-containing protein [Meiothermus sp.]
MLPRPAQNPFTTSEVADPLESIRVRLTLWLLPLGALAALLAWGFSAVAQQLSPPDAWLLWPLALTFVALEIHLFRNPRRINRVWLIALGVISVYTITQVFYEAGFRLHQHQSISPALLWFPMVYLMAFVSFGRRQAVVFSVYYLLAGLLAGVAGLVWYSPPLSAVAVNAAAQFALSNLTYVLLLYIFAHLRRYYAQMHQMAYSDHLTGLSNRRSLQGALEAELERAKRYKRPFAVLALDIDHFKRINDSAGHAVGDQVLREMASRLAQHLRDTDRAARWGGEEFLVLAPETDLSAAHALASRLHHDIRSEPVAGLPVTISIGVACYREGDSIAGLLSRADEALYRAKAAGRNRVMVEEEPKPPTPTLPGVKRTKTD